MDARPTLLDLYRLGRLARSYAEATADAGLHPFEETLLSGHWPASAPEVLVVGCGAGREIGAIAARSRSVLAIDQSAAMVEQTRRKAAALGSAVTARHSDVAGLAAGSARFDVVVAFNVLHTMCGDETGKRAETLSAARRLLKPGGVFLGWARQEPSVLLQLVLRTALLPGRLKLAATLPFPWTEYPPDYRWSPENLFNRRPPETAVALFRAEAGGWLAQWPRLARQARLAALDAARRAGLASGLPGDRSIDGCEGHFFAHGELPRELTAAGFDAETFGDVELSLGAPSFFGSRASNVCAFAARPAGA